MPTTIECRGQEVSESTAAVYVMPFDLKNPPDEPPPGCRHPDRWQRAYLIYRKHEPGPQGRCKRSVCDEPFPCPGHKMALRALIDACAGTTNHSIPHGLARIVSTSTCRWCRRVIQLHSRYGWVHVEYGFLLCREPPAECPPFCRAEPIDATERTHGTAQPDWASRLGQDSERSVTYTPTPGTP